MNETTLNRIRRVFDPELEALGPGRPLEADVLGTLYALLQVLADDSELPRSHFERTVQRRSTRDLSQMREYVAGARLLDVTARRRFGQAFADASPAWRDEVLHVLLGGEYPSPDDQPWLVRRLRLTSHNLHLVLSRPSIRHFRKFVVADLLSYYYTTARGWAVVGYREFPGFVRSEAEPCEVRGVRIEGRHVVLELSDQCTERLRPETLRVDGQGRFVCETKAGRQSAVFSREAQLALGELLEESPEGIFLRVAGTSREVDLGDAAR